MNVGGIVFLCIFFGIVGFLIFLAIWGSRKDKNKRQREVVKRKKDDNLSKVKHIELYLKLYFLIEDLEKRIKFFDPLTGIYSIGDINRNFSQAILEIKNSADLKDVFLFEERKDEFKPIVDELSSIRPTKWESESIFAVNIIKAKSQFIVKDPKNIEYVKIAKEWVKNKAKKE
ncbi:MAG: hypothetical protein HPAVJP_1870 [Candidatus Hepatoplasma vulgare]|nr:MAG: hypothetical protein HPAVJP_1870 [Candidatus Hepatoplasma sp.]